WLVCVCRVSDLWPVLVCDLHKGLRRRQGWCRTGDTLRRLYGICAVSIAEFRVVCRVAYSGNPGLLLVCSGHGGICGCRHHRRRYLSEIGIGWPKNCGQARILVSEPKVLTVGLPAGTRCNK